jgi:lipopolysaccharide export system permease protein
LKTIDRYILRELAVTTVCAVAVLSGFLVFGNVLRRAFDLILNEEIPLGLLMKSTAYLLPFCLTFALPWGFVTAVLLVFGRLSAENELTALRTSGISLIRVCAPTILLACLLSLLCLWLNCALIPRAQMGLKKTLRQIAADHPAALLVTNQVHAKARRQRFYVGEKKGAKLSNIILFQLDAALRPTRVLFAKEGEIRGGSAAQDVELRLIRASVEEWSAPFDPAKIHESFRLMRGETSVALDHFSSAELRRPPLSAMTLTRIFRYRARLTDAAGTVQFEINRRFSFSLAVFVLTLVSLPLAVGAHRRELSVAFALSLVVVFGYYLILGVAESNRYRTQAHPELLVWIPNALFLACGVLLLRRANHR